MWKLFFKRKKATSPIPSQPQKSKELYATEFIKQSPYLAPNAEELLIKYLTKPKEEFFTGEFLSKEEKKSLGINPRLKIDRIIPDVLTPKGLELPDPRVPITGLFYSVQFALTRDKEIQKAKELGIKEIKIMTCNDERDCLWCQNMDGKKLSITSNINSLILTNCTCSSHCRLIIQPVINL